MGIHDRIEAELKKIVKSEDLDAAKRVREDFLAIAEGMDNDALVQDGNLINILLSDGIINEKQAYHIMQKAGINHEQSTSMIKAKESIAKAIGALQGAKETLLMAKKSEESHIEFPDTCAETMPPKPTAKPAQQKKAKTVPNRYADLTLLGQGGMGAVYKAHDIMMDRDVALKTLRPGITGQNRILYLNRFQNEVKATAQLADCEYIVVAYNVEKTPAGTVFMTMEYVPGESLSDIINKIHFDSKQYTRELKKRKKHIEEQIETFKKDKETVQKCTKTLEEITEELKTGKETKRLEKEHEEYTQKYNIRELMTLFLQTCTAVSYTHDHGYVHRDIKPPNIMIRKGDNRTKEKAKLMDFGLAKRLEEPTSEYIEGTPQYMGPQQFECEQQNPQDDIYAMGAILYKILTGKLPFDGETTEAIALKVLTKEEAVHASAIKEGLAEKPPELCEIAMKALKKDVEERYATMDEMADDIRAWLEYKPVTVYRESGRQAIKRNLKRRPWIKYVAGAAAGVLALGLAIGGPILYMSESKAKQKAAQAQIEKQKAEKADQERQKAEQAEKQAKEAKQKSEREQAERAEKRRLAMDEHQKGLDFVRRRDYENAERYFDRAININDLADAHFEKGLIRYSNFDGFEAVKEFERANQSSRQESKQIHKPAMFYAGFVNIDHLDNPQKATEYFRQLITEANDEQDYYVMLSKSLTAFTEEKYEEAIKWAETATQQYSKAWEGWLLRALYRMQGIGGPFSKPGLMQHRDFKEAYHSLEKALEINPGQIRCLERRIKLNCGLLRNMDQTLEDAQQLVQDYPKLALFRSILGTVHYFRNEYEKSLEILKQAEQMNDQGSNNLIFQALVYMRLAEEKTENKEYHYRKSEEYYTRAITITPYADQIAGRAYVRVQLNNLEGALEDIRTALNADPNNGRAHYALAIYYGKKDKTEQAIQEFETAITLKFYEAHRELGLLYSEIQEKEKALQQLTEYIKREIPHRRQEAINKIRELENN